MPDQMTMHLTSRCGNGEKFATGPKIDTEIEKENPLACGIATHTSAAKENSSSMS